MSKLILSTLLILILGNYAYSTEAKNGNKPFFPLSPECQQHCEKEGERVDFRDSKMESQCDCYPE